MRINTPNSSKSAPEVRADTDLTAAEEDWSVFFTFISFGVSSETKFAYLFTKASS